MENDEPMCIERDCLSSNRKERERKAGNSDQPSRNQLMREGKEVRYLPMRRKKRLDGRSYTARMRMREREESHQSNSIDYSFSFSHSFTLIKKEFSRDKE